jgi:hypothetical protein
MRLRYAWTDLIVFALAIILLIPFFMELVRIATDFVADAR